MSESMPNIKKHSCPSCGGQLRVNLDKQMYECPFCGVSYDYEYFREDDVLSRARRFQTSGEWGAASDAYNFLLSKEPHNFQALRGKILVAAHMKKPEEMSLISKYREVNFTKVDECLKQALRDTDSAHKEYFEKMEEIFSCGKTYDDQLDHDENSLKERRKLRSKIDSKEEEKQESIALIVGPALAVAMMEAYFLLGYFQEKKRAAEEAASAKKFNSYYQIHADKSYFLMILSIIGAIILVAIVVFGLYRYFRVRIKNNKEIAGIEDELDFSENDHMSYQNEANEMQKRINKLCHELKKLDKMEA